MYILFLYGMKLLLWKYHTLFIVVFNCNFNFHWTKFSYQNNLNNIAFFFTFFKGYRCNKYYQLSALMRVQENICQISQNDILHMKFSEFYLCFQNSYEIWYFDFCWVPMRNSLCCYYRQIISIALENIYKKNVILCKLF